MAICRICKKQEAELLFNTKKVCKEYYDMLLKKKLHKKEEKNLKIFEDERLLG